MLLVYVDDILLVGRLEAITRVKEELAKLFTVTDLGEATFFLGIGIMRDRSTRTVTLSQGRYGLDVLDRFGMVEAKPARTSLPAGFKFEKVEGEGAKETSTREYQSAVGSLMYLVLGTRPDLAFVVGAVGRYMSAPKQHHRNGVQHILRYLRGTL
jgi:hypothetical protein